MASIRDVAKHAGVAARTVSRVLNGTACVSPETKQKIEQAMEELNYIPNELARGMFRQRSGIIAMLVLHALYKHTGERLKHWLDIYQINCTFYSALGNNDAAYLLARAIQFFAPGVPQVYYVGMLAGENDLELLESTKEGRNINRHYYSVDEVNRCMEREAVKKLKKLMEFRNQCKAFDGECFCETEGEKLVIKRQHQQETAVLEADLKTYAFRILVNGSEVK